MEKQLRAKISLKNPSHLLAFGFGSGLIPLMPGTFGSLAAIPILIGMSFLNTSLFIVVTILAFVLGIKLCQIASEALGSHDHGSIVWDEIAGMMVTFLFVPIDALSLFLGFLLFRFFDILKPWPINVIDQKVHGGFGIMIDDIVAGAMACLSLHFIYLFII